MSTTTPMNGAREDHAPLLAVRGASKAFPGVQALGNVDLTVKHGEVLALVGENGAGKSTLMKLLSGIYTPDTGKFELNGEAFEPSSPKHAQELGISIIHQELNLMPDLTVAENIFIGREPRRAGFVLSDKELRTQTVELLQRLDLKLNPDALVGSLSVAQQQMVEIAKALSYDAKVLIMDEPTAALNDAEVATLFDLIRRFISPETGVIYISHRLPELPQIADSIAVLRDGENAGAASMAETSNSQIVALMVGREIKVEQRPQPPAKVGDVALRVDGLSTATLLKDISFEARRGEILGFSGLMGAGRTELARAIIGADPMTSGTIEVNGTAKRIPNPATAADLGIGYLSEDRKGLGVLVERDVRENIALPSLKWFTRGPVVDMRRMDKAAREHVEALRIKTPSTTQVVRNLSGGNQQKIAIAKWLEHHSDILIFDEPTRGIDVGAKEEIYGLLQQLADEGKAIIVISSDLPELIRLAHRIAVMADGRLTATVPNEDATQETLMEYATHATTEAVA
ncbi:sugar ABC transporter ATP-binding protein [Demequina flava]|uniref:sugar ABC transporter ATP-binding protein n=1 Tax=Demequina flava TaxID=1095025 RepID=UPI000A99BEB9|nr:sugar ABC transporter ATP-binding protein [Demequina flava]